MIKVIPRLNGALDHPGRLEVTNLLNLPGFEEPDSESKSREEGRKREQT